MSMSTQAAPLQDSDMTQLATRLVDVLRQETQYLDVLRTLLLAEQDGLASLAPDTLGSLASEKNRILSELARCESSRAELLTQLSPKVAANATWPDALNGLSATLHDSIRQLWAGILQCTREVSILNQQNGQIIETSVRHVRGALEVLCSGSPSLYNTSGHSELPAPSRMLGSA